MILLWIFFIFEVEVPGGFRAWFQQSFCTSEYSLMLLVAWMPWCLPRSLPGCLGVCRNVLGRLLFIGVWGWGEWHVANFDWWIVSQSNWRSFKTFSRRHVASFDWLKCLDFQGNTCQQLIGLLMSSLIGAKCHCLHMLMCGMCRCLHALMCD